MHGILLVSERINCYDAGSILGENPKTMERWVNEFNEKGFNALRKGTGEFGYEQNLWDGKLLMHHISEKFHVKVGVRACQLIFHRLKFRRLKPRTVISKGDPTRHTSPHYPHIFRPCTEYVLYSEFQTCSSALRDEV